MKTSRVTVTPRITYATSRREIILAAVDPEGRKALRPYQHVCPLCGLLHGAG